MKLNCDLGENVNNWKSGVDIDLLKLVDSVNISCGAHAGNASLIQKTVESAIDNKKEIGAHPSYPDFENFGRLSLKISSLELLSTLKEQLSFLKDIVESNGGKITYLKPHGALYHDCMTFPATLEVVTDAMHAVGLEIPLMLLAGFQSEKVLIREAFIDRRYLTEKSLVNRVHKNAVIQNPDLALQQFIELSQNNRVKLANDSWASLNADSGCIHSDTPNALAIARRIRSFISLNG